MTSSLPLRWLRNERVMVALGVWHERFYGLNG